jgi:RNA polymerase-binding transcription factor DksA
LEENELEMAEMLSQAHMENMIAVSRMALAPEIHEKFNGTSCVECGNDIHKDRLAMGRVRCTNCQSAQERMKKLYRN